MYEKLCVHWRLLNCVNIVLEGKYRLATVSHFNLTLFRVIKETMAKSIRSKRKRKLRNIKRVRYAKKELERLKKTLGISDDQEMKDVTLEPLQDVATVVDGNVIEFSLKEEKKEKESVKKLTPDIGLLKIGEAEALLKEDENMEVVTEKDVKKLGKFPKWMNQRQIKKMSRSMQKNKKRVKRLQKKNLKK